jgi:hypothetical protein
MIQGLLICLSLGLATGAACLSTFGGTEKLVFMRERVTGQSNVIYLISKLVSTLPNEALIPLVFMAIYQWMTVPVVEFWKIYIVALGICDVSMNIAHLLSILLSDNRALIVTVVTICICNILSGMNPTLHQLKGNLGSVVGTALPALSYSRWSMEAFYLSVVSNYRHIYNLDFSLMLWDYSFSEFSRALVMPFVIGMVLRLVALIAIIIIGKSRNQ